MTTEQLQFIFSLFSFVGVVGILFYIILDKAKSDELRARINHLEKEFLLAQKNLEEEEEEKEKNNVLKSNLEGENEKNKIIALYEEGADVELIEDALNIPKAKIEMVLKFHHLNKSDNWRESVDNTL